MDGKITYHQQVTYCGKPRCRKCREGVGHGPYWYAYRTVEGQTTRTYIGKQLPPDAQTTTERPANSTGESAMPDSTPAPVPAPDPAVVTLRILTLGQFRLERRAFAQGQPAGPWQAVTDAAWQLRQDSQVRSLLAYLICSPGRRVNRSQVLDTLWPDLDMEGANKRLNKTIQHLQKILVQTSPGQLETSPRTSSLPLRTDGEWLILAGQERISVDADIFSAMLQQLELPLASITDELSSQLAVREREQAIGEAVTLYGGDLLPEERDAEWVLARRQVLRRGWSGLILQLADLAMAREGWSDAIDALNRLLAKDPTNELAVQRLIFVLAHLKRRVEALQVYQRFASVLQREYQALPSSETLELYEVVRRGGELPGLPQTGSTTTHVAPVPDKEQPADDRHARSNRELLVETIGRTHQSPLVGRDAELEVMRSMLLQVERGVHMQLAGVHQSTGIPLDTQRRPQCLLLMGDAGIGKTRLSEEVSREARRHGWVVVWSRLYTQESSVPYRVWTEALYKVLALSSGPLPDLDPDLWQPLTSLLPELSERISPIILDRATPQMLSPRQEQFRLWEAISDLLKAVSESMPLLIVLDDIQWADHSSYELLGHLARRLYGYPIMFLATCRDAELSRRPMHPLLDQVSHMQRERSIQTLRVEPLTSEQIGELVASLSQLPDALVKNIQDQAAGNPFFAEELARSTPPVLPRTVVAALDHRVGRLSEACRLLLKNASVLGGTFEFAQICAMESASDGADSADEDTVLTLLEEALHAGVLTDEGAGTRILYHFWHPLLVSRLYELLSGVRRARLHLRAADVLQHMHRGREEEVAATITDHLIKGDAQPVQIAHYAELAGNRAYAVFAYSEAKDHYQQAVEHIQMARQASDQSRLASLLERLAECVAIRGNFAEARDYYERVLALHSQLPMHAQDPQQQAREAQIEALLLVEIGWTWSYTGDDTFARQSCERAEQVLHQAKLVGGPVWARLYHLRGSLFELEGRYDEAMQSMQEAIDLFEQQEQILASQPSSRTQSVTSIQRTLAGDPINLGRAHRFMATIAQSMGQPAKVQEHLNKALAIYEQYKEQRQIAHLSCGIGYFHLKKAEYELSRIALERAFDLAVRIGDEPLISLVYGDQGELAAANGELTQAEEYYKRALEMAEEITKDRAYMSTWNAGLATVLQAQGKLTAAATCIVHSWRISRAMDNKRYMGLALVTLGNMRIAQAIAIEKTASPYKKMKAVERQNKHARLLFQADKDLQRALSLALLDVETRARGHLAQAHVVFLQGKREEARSQIQQVIRDAQRCGLAQVVLRARELLAQVSNTASS